MDRQLYQAGLRSRLGLPLQVEGQIIGALMLGWVQPQGYDLSRLPLLNQIADIIALAVERSRLFDEVQHHSTQMAALYELSIVVNSSLEPDRVLQMAVNRVVPLLEARQAGIFLREADGQLHHGAVSASTLPWSDDERLALARLLWEHHLPAGKSLQVVAPASITDKLPLFRNLKNQGVHSIVVLPLIHSNITLGMMVVLLARTEVHAHEVRLTQTVAQIISPAIAHAQSFHLTYEQLQQTNQRLTLVNQISRSLSAILDKDRLLDEVLRLVQGKLGYDYVGLGLIKDDEIIFHSVADSDDARPLTEISIQVERQGIAGWVAATGQPYLSPDVRQDPHYHPHPLLTEIRSELVVPIRLSDCVSEVLMVSSDRLNAFDEADMALLQAIADQLALAMENARAYSRLQEQTEMLARANAELERTARAKMDFVNRINHELRTPLTSILGFSELLEMDHASPLPERQVRFVRQIRSSGEHLLTLVNDLLDVARMEANKLALHPERIVVASMFEEVVSMLSKPATDKNIRLEININPHTLWLIADRTRFRQILLNLMSNAVKFTPAGGRVVLSAAVQGEDKNRPEVLLTVADTGIGIKPEDYEKIFAQFEQIDSELGRSQLGTGLGMVVTKQLVELHGGRIWFESVYGEGATFYVALPVKHGVQAASAMEDASPVEVYF